MNILNYLKVENIKYIYIYNEKPNKNNYIQYFGRLFK